MHEFSGYFYVNLDHGQFMHAIPIYDSIEWVWRHAAESDWLLIFEMSVDEFNHLNRIGQQLTYEQYAQDLEKADASGTNSATWYQKHRSR